MTLNLSSIRAVIADMDGVIWRGTDTLPGVPDFFLFLRERQIPYVLATNNASRSIAEFCDQIGRLGIPIDGDHIVTSSTVTLEEMGRTYPAGTPIYVIGSPTFIGLFEARGYVIDPHHAQVVIVGRDVNIDWEKLVIATRRILAGADFIGTNGDLTFPTPDGLEPGNGAILAALQAATGREPRVMGKPQAAMFQSALNRLGTKPEQTLMIGDRLDTDIEGAKRAGLCAALVLTGVTQSQEVDTQNPYGPDGIYRDLPALQAAWTSNNN